MSAAASEPPRQTLRTRLIHHLDALTHIAPLVEDWLDNNPTQATALARLTGAIARGENIYDRRHMGGHLTASAILASPDRTQVFLVHIRALDRWLAPGGHVDPGEMPQEAAHRELLEETGLVAHPAVSTLTDIDVHTIPARPSRNEGEHPHFDFRYLMTGNPEQSGDIDRQEIISGCWKPVEAIKQDYPRVYAVLRRS